MSFTKTELEYLAGQPIGRLATVSPNGAPQVNPVGFTIDPISNTLQIHGFQMAKSRKFRNIADNGRVALVIDDIISTNPWRVRCIEIRGHAEALLPDDTAHGPLDGATITIHPRRIISFGIDEPDQEPHLLTPNARNVPDAPAHPAKRPPKS